MNLKTKTIFGVLILFVLLFSILALAQPQKEKNSNVKYQEQTQKQERKQTNNDANTNMEENTQKIKEDIRERIRLRQRLLEQEIEEVAEPAKKNALKNQNAVRLAVHTLLEMENRTGGIGAQIREVAREFNNGINKTLQAEERVQLRSKLKRFFLGGDNKAADEIESEIQKNRERIRKLKDYREQCECDEEIRQILQEQIQVMEQEQTRLQQIAEKEKKSKGIFGWLFK